MQVDQCTGCRGVFLDRGELERLIDAEGAYYERGEDREHRGGGLSEMGGLGGLLGGNKHKEHGGQRKKHKRESFLSDLFD
jgi:Zn-finger nucleic acid-binding protein